MTQIITVHGGLVAPPELKFTNNGTPFATFTVASTDRVQQDGKWVDGKDKLFLRCTAWGTIGENIDASALPKGAQVLVTGKLLTREWEHEGQKRSSTELKVTDFAVSLKHATATPVRAAQNATYGGGNPGATSNESPWGGSSAQNVAQGGFGGGAAFDDEQPF